MNKSSASHRTAVIQALFVTFLWSTSWVLIKMGLRDIPALTFAGLRYVVAAACLLPFALTPANRAAMRRLTRRDWARLAVLGLFYYTLSQSTMFVALAYLPAMTVTLILNFTSPLVAILGIVWLAERPTRLQWWGMALFGVGVVIYFYPSTIPATQVIGWAAAVGGVVANALSTVLGRRVNRTAQIPTLLVTAISMSMGAVLMLGAGLAIQGLPAINLSGWAIIAWLAVVNTALAFTLWNYTQRTLSAVESSIINNTMLVQIALLAWLFLGEGLNLQKITGMALVAAGALAVQLRRPSPKADGLSDQTSPVSPAD